MYLNLLFQHKLPLPQHILCFCHTTQNTTRGTPNHQVLTQFLAFTHYFLWTGCNSSCQALNPSYKPYSFSKIKIKCLFSVALAGDKIPLAYIQFQNTNLVSSFCALKVHFFHIYHGTCHIILEILYLLGTLNRLWPIWSVGEEGLGTGHSLT